MKDTTGYILDRTYRADSSIEILLERADRIRTDPEKEQRLKNLLCKYCYYVRGSRLAGQAFTEYTCGVCKKIGMWGDTSIPRLCKECATDNKACYDCGAKLNVGKKS